MLREDHIAWIMPRCPGDKRGEYIEHLTSTMRWAGITTVLRSAMYLGQLAHESNEFRHFEELSNGQAYEGRANLGNTQPGDGPRYKGRGPIQITGRWNYQAASDALGIDLISTPEIAAQPAVGFKIAAWYWSSRNLNDKADTFDFMAVTRAINGGLNGIDQRLAYYKRALEVLARDAVIV